MLDTILKKHLDAMGGLRNWDRVESIRLSGIIERDGQSLEIVIIKKRPNQIRATVTLPLPGNGGKFIQMIRAHDGKNAWSATRLVGAPEMVKEPMRGNAADNLLADGGVLPPLIKLWRGGGDLRLLGVDVFEGTPVFVIESTGETDNAKQHFYLSTETHLIVAHNRRSPSGMTRVHLSNYREEQGIVWPMHSLISGDGTGESIMTTTSVEIGVGIYEEYFKADEQSQTANL